MLQPISLVIESDSENVLRVAGVVNRLCSLIPLSVLDSYKIELCVVEAVNNAIKHAYDGRQGENVEVVFTVLDKEFQVDVCDYGRRMDLGGHASLEFDPTDLAKLPEGGMGLYIIWSLMDKVSYSTEQGKNILRMSKLISIKEKD